VLIYNLPKSQKFGNNCMYIVKNHKMFSLNIMHKAVMQDRRKLFLLELKKNIE